LLVFERFCHVDTKSLSVCQRQ